ncbi:hypothetical protein TNCV_3103331 [Trichonephila clavipes]|nr:hypothetical protein TNCV_3103331 [Trichonephila clavipes]
MPSGQIQPRASSVVALFRNRNSYSFCRRLRCSVGVQDEERNWRSSLINVDLVELVRQRVMENRRFTITELNSQFPQISRSLFHSPAAGISISVALYNRW